MHLGSRVRLISFNGTLAATEACDPKENYWLLIGEHSVVVAEINPRNRLLIQFDASIAQLGLHCHNRIQNSLYIQPTDLVLLGA